MRQANGAAKNIRLGERRVVHAATAELFLQPPRHLEDATLAFDFAEVLFAGDVGHIFTEDEDFWVAPHFVLHAHVEHVHHRGRLAGELRVVLGVELLARRIHVRRVDGVVHGAGVGLRLAERVVSGGEHFGVYRFLNRGDLGVGGKAFVHQPLGIVGDRIARRVGISLCSGAVHHLVIGE